MIVLILLLLAGPAYAHGEAGWIMADPQTRFCCGSDDCRRLKATEVSHDATGWKVNGYRVANVYPTKPEGGAEYWACFNLPELITPRCLFLPAMF